VSRHTAEILGEPHIEICECRICVARGTGEDGATAPPLPREGHHPSLLGASIDELEHLENEEAAQHFTPE